MSDLWDLTLGQADALRSFAPFFRGLGETFLWWMLLHWTAGPVLVAAVALALRRLPRMNAATRTRIWLVTLLALAGLPLLAWQLESPRAARARSEVAIPKGSSEIPGQLASAAMRPAQSVSAHPTGDRPLRMVRNAQGLLASLPAIGACCWLTWMLLRSVRLVGAVLALFGLRLRSRPDEPTSDRLAALASRAGVVAPPVRRAPVDGPCCVGLLLPWVALPEEPVEPLDGSRGGPGPGVADEVLLHELAHSTRRDGLTGFWLQLARVLLVGSPVAGWLGRRIVAERESACDDWVVAHTGAPVRYGRVLLAEAERVAGRERAWRRHSRRRPALALGMADSCKQRRGTPTVLRNSPTRRRSELRERMERMFDAQRTHGARESRTATLVCVGALALSSFGFAWSWPNAPGLQLQGLIAWNPEEGVSALRLSADDAPLYRAIRSGEYDEVADLIARGEDPRQIWPGDGSPLIVAARRGALDMAQLLIDSGAEVDHAVAGDASPLVAAVQAGHVEMVELLLANGADIDFAPGNGDGSPLIAASLAGQVHVVELLLERGAQIDTHVVGDDTALINAAQQGHLATFRCLLLAGADPWVTGDYDFVLGEERTALNQARANGHEEITGILDGTIPLGSVSKDGC